MMAAGDPIAELEKIAAAHWRAPEQDRLGEWLLRTQISAIMEVGWVRVGDSRAGTPPGMPPPVRSAPDAQRR